VRQFAEVEVRDVVRTGAAGGAIQPGEVPHPECYGVIRACGVAADPQAADHLPVRVERDAAAERDDSTRHVPDPCSWNSGLKGLELFNP
jgi:hypothetical protein